MTDAIEAIIEEHDINTSDLITPEQLPSDARSAVELPEQQAPQALQHASSTLSELINEHQELLAMQPPTRNDPQPNTYIQQTLRFIDDHLETSLERGYLNKKKQEAKHEHHQELAAYNQESYELLTDFYEHIQRAAEEFTQAQERVASYEHALRTKHQDLEDAIEQQEDAIKHYSQQLKSIDEILESEEHEKNVDFYAEHADADIQELYEENREETEQKLKDAVRAYRFLNTYKEDHIPQQLERAQDVLATSKQTMPHFREIAAKVHFALKSYQGLTEPMQRLTMLNNAFDQVGAVVDKLDDGQDAAKRAYDISAQTLELNAKDRKRLRGE